MTWYLECHAPVLLDALPFWTAGKEDGSRHVMWRPGAVCVWDVLRWLATA